MGLSDEREKTNIEKVGKDPETGLMLYSYDYKDDVEAAKKSGKSMPPKRVSPMAQDIEKMDPRAVREVGGKKGRPAASRRHPRHAGCLIDGRLQPL